MKCIEFFFDFSCPYAYIASQRIEAFVREEDVVLEWKPMLLGGVFKARGTPQHLAQTMGPAKSRHNQLDIQRWATHFGISLNMPENHPMRSVRALRTLLGLPKRCWPLFIHRVYESYWRKGDDIASAKVMERILSTIELSSMELASAKKANNEPSIKKELFDRSDEAVAKGVFGAPTIFFRDNESIDQGNMYWGQDCFEMLRANCRGWDPSTRRVKQTTQPLAPSSSESDCSVDFWFDFASPYAYLAATQMSRIEAAYAVTMRWQPMLLGALFRSIGTPDVPLFEMNQAKRDYMTQDLTRWANFLGVPFRFTSHFPIRSVLPLRVCLLAKDKCVKVAELVMHALWADDLKIDDPKILRAILKEHQLDEGWVDGASAPMVKEALKNQNERAVKKGVFGTPTFIVKRKTNDELFWGQDRLPLVEAALQSSTALD